MGPAERFALMVFALSLVAGLLGRAMLKGMLMGTYKRELQLYSTVVTSGDGLTRRT